MKVGVFGFSSDIGHMFKIHLESKGIDVVNIGRTNPANHHSYQHFDLQHPVQIDLGDLDFIFMFGWIQRPRNSGTARLNFEGYEVIRDSIEKSSVKAVFITTMLACESSESFHARAKFKCEELFVDKHKVVRIGQIRSSNSSVIGKSAQYARILERFAQIFRLDVPLLLPYVYETSVIRELDKIFTDQSEARLTVFDGFDKLGERNRINGVFRLKAGSISKKLGYINRVTRLMNLVVGDRFQALYSAQQQLFDLTEKVKHSEPNSEMCC